MNSPIFDKPITHIKCGGLIHFELECYEYNDYYSVCDKCGKEWPDWDDVIRENK
jgi:Cys-tRNA synthase (O-phospho-L-seryl-tRNA:Cys-tRNA synthase)